MVTGGYFDISRHIMDRPETFLTIQHLAIYAGVGIVAVSALLGILLRRYSTNGPALKALYGLKIAVIGTSVQLIAGPFDFWWHGAYGFDPVLLSPPHVMLIAGAAVNGLAAMTGMATLWKIGVILTRKIITPFLILACTALWLQLNLVVFTIADIEGIEYQYRIFSGAHLVIPLAYRTAWEIFGLLMLAVPGILVLTSCARIFGRFGGVSAVASTFIIVNSITSIVERGFAWYLPIEASMIIPLMLFDYLASRRRFLPAALIMAPFTYTLYFPFSGYYFGTDIPTALMFTAVLSLPYLLIGYLSFMLARRLTF